MNNWIVIFLFFLWSMFCHSKAYSSDSNNTNLDKPLFQSKIVPKISYPKHQNDVDPFFAKPKSSPKLAPKQEQFSIKSLRYSGLIRQEAALWAIISRPNGEIISVKAGDYLKGNRLKVIKITERLLLLEQRVLISGKWEKKIKALYMKKR